MRRPTSCTAVAGNPSETHGSGWAARTFRAIGTDATVAVTDPTVADLAATALRSLLRTLDEACSRFRPDAEIASLGAHAGAWVTVSDVLYDALETACAAARLTGGAVDPTVLGAVERLGYDRDFSLLDDPVPDTALAADAPSAHPPSADAPSADVPARDGHVPAPVPGWWRLDLDPATRRARLPEGVGLDLGSSAKARAADRAAGWIAARLGTGALVGLGGDISVAGPTPAHGWRVGVAARSSARPGDVDQVLGLRRGALASSAPGVRAWRQDGTPRHHIVDPFTGRCAPTCWQLVSVLAPSCVEANALSTASIVWGADAPDRLRAYGRAARLVRRDGTVVPVGAWPAADRAAVRPPLGRERSGSVR